jgi:hypothetical protein
MPDPGEELGSLDFGAMIGGPLTAVINAQSQAAMASVDFIKGVGFVDDEPIMVEFKYTRLAPDPANPGEEAEREFSLTVPILTMLPVPFIRVQDTTIEFNAKIVATQFKKTDTSLNLGTELAAKGGYGPFSASLKVNFSYQRKTSEGEDVARTYSMAIRVHAVQEEMPAGTERLLTILENTIQEVPA